MVRWATRENGEITCLRKSGGSGWCGGSVKTVFFTNDSVRIVSGRVIDTSISQLFVGNCTVAPAFRIGEPSKVCYNLKFIRDYPDGLDLEFSYTHMEVTDLPPAVEGPIFAGDEMQFCVTAVPLPIRDEHAMDLNVYPGDRHSGSDAFSLGAVFNDDGSLRYINEGSCLGTKEEEDRRLPKAFPPAVTYSRGSKWVLRAE